MNDNDVDALLRQIGLRDSDKAPYDFPRREMIDRLMNMTLQCLGALRCLVVEEEKSRISEDCCDIDGSKRDDGHGNRIKREVFHSALMTIGDTIVAAQDLDVVDPLKDLVETYPWEPAIYDSSWLCLPWLLSGGVGGSLAENREETAQLINNSRLLLEEFPELINEIDKKGQHYMNYACKTNNSVLIQTLIDHTKDCVRFKDGSGKQAIHYAAQWCQSTEPLYLIVEAMGIPANDVMGQSFDDEGNLPIHTAAAGCGGLAVLKEVIFSNPDVVRLSNKEGKTPLHIGACRCGIDVIKAIFAAYPNAVSQPDRNGWYPLYHAVYNTKDVSVVQYLLDAYGEANKKPHQSGRLPLHYAAVTCVSSKVMRFILDKNPAATRALDVNRRLPIHNCIARCSYMNPARLRCLRLLLEVYPEGAGMSGVDGRTPLDLARRDRHGALVLRLLLRADPSQDPEALGEITYIASKAKYKARSKGKESDLDERKKNES